LIEHTPREVSEAFCAVADFLEAVPAEVMEKYKPTA
jgi:hypothetical protein